MLGVGLIVGGVALVAIYCGGTISLIVGHGASVWAVDGNLVIVGAESVPVGVRVGEKSSLEHLAV
jgi:hypothetical protein